VFSKFFSILVTCINPQTGQIPSLSQTISRAEEKPCEGKPEDSRELPFWHVLLMKAGDYDAKFRSRSVPQPSSLLVLVAKVSPTWEMILNGKHLNHQPPHNS